MDFVGIGNALVDVVAYVDEEFAPSLGFHNNAVVHLESGRLDAVLSRLPDAGRSAGGGAANTLRAVAVLGEKAAYAGCVGEDELGRLYLEDLRVSGVESLVGTSPSPTGVYCALIRPDGGRTLLVAPGAALDLCLEPPPPRIFRKGALLYIEGFLLGNRGFFMDCLRSARDASMEIALDLCSQGLVRAEREFILEVLPEYCDLLFANEDEFLSLVEMPLAEGCALLGDLDLTIVVKRAERGAVWARGGRLIDSPVRAVHPVDQTGAGDAFAAGFLVGRARGLAPERCLRLGNRLAEEVLAVPGFGIDPERLNFAARRVSA
jgi:sugar/nucleoside kinase (ribokinase family)